MHIDGQATRSCLTPMSAVFGRSVTTIEGLSENGDHPLQLAWLKHRVPQCGYCQAGQIMSAATLLEANPNGGKRTIKSDEGGDYAAFGWLPVRIDQNGTIVKGRRSFKVLNPPILQPNLPDEEGWGKIG